MSPPSTLNVIFPLLKWLLRVQSGHSLSGDIEMATRGGDFGLGVELKVHWIVIVEFPQIFAVQHVDVCMFSNGKFKNVVADILEANQIAPGESLNKIYEMLPLRGE